MSFYSTLYPFGTPSISTSIIDAGTFGIDPTGTNDSYPGLQAALNAARSTGASTGIVLIPPGTFRLSQALTPKDGTVIMGSGMYSTTLLAPSIADPVLGCAFYIAAPSNMMYMNSMTVRDLQVDGTNQYRPGGTPGQAQANVPSAIWLQGINNLLIENVSVKNPAGFGIFVGTPWSTRVKSVVVRHARVTGEWNGNDALGGGGIENLLVDDFWATDCYGSGMDLLGNTHDTRRHIRITRPTISASTFRQTGISADTGEIDADWYDITVDNSFNGITFSANNSTNPTYNFAPTRIRIRDFSLTNIQEVGIYFNTPKGYPASNVQIADGYIGSFNANNVFGAGIYIQGGSNFLIHDVEFDTPTNPAYAFVLTMDGGHGSGGTPFNRSTIHDCDVSKTYGIWLLDVDLTTVRFHDNPGFNPQGTSVTQPTVGTSPWTFTNNYGSDAIVNVFGGTVSSITVGSQATGRTSGEFFLPVGMSMTITYTAAPTVNVYVN